MFSISFRKGFFVRLLEVVTKLLSTLNFAHKVLYGLLLGSEEEGVLGFQGCCRVCTSWAFTRLPRVCWQGCTKVPSNTVGLCRVVLIEVS